MTGLVETLFLGLWLAAGLMAALSIAALCYGEYRTVSEDGWRAIGRWTYGVGREIARDIIDELLPAIVLWVALVVLALLLGIFATGVMAVVGW
ncbi:hypothetical protein [Halomarina oriensis]|uniref:Uncharacterized protein n=1 Tax=Halomarina oriensis TaxID=671145 RepID=A0A6B0GNY6_9EURY|nr:hypothetical protein [Halomarina oriensis]MWG36522.1 hypothetical protein [Halomarina oriensis]